MKKTSTVRVNGNMIFKGHKLSRLVWTLEIAGRSTASWMKQAKSFWNKNCRQRLRSHEGRPLEKYRSLMALETGDTFSPG